jgi:hypothetical protein
MHCSNDPIPQGYSLRQTVDMVRLDTLIQQDVWLMKIDVEGFEFMVLSGASELFKRYKIHYLLSEVSPRMMKDAGVDYREYYVLLKRAGFECSLSGFDGPFLEIPLVVNDKFQNPNTQGGDPYNIYCKGPQK